MTTEQVLPDFQNLDSIPISFGLHRLKYLKLVLCSRKKQGFSTTTFLRKCGQMLYGSSGAFYMMVKQAWFPNWKDLHVNRGCAIQRLVSLAFLVCETAISHFTGCGGLDVLTYGKPGMALGTQLVPNK